MKFSGLKAGITNEKKDAFIQFIKFGIVGVSNTLISYFVYLIFLFLLGEEYYLVGSVAGFFVSVLNSFYWNDKYVFKKKENENRSKWKALVKVILSYALTGLVLNNILLVIFVGPLHIAKAYGPLIVLLITVPLNFIINKLWAFKGNNQNNK